MFSSDEKINEFYNEHRGTVLRGLERDLDLEKNIEDVFNDFLEEDISREKLEKMIIGFNMKSFELVFDNFEKEYMGAQFVSFLMRAFFRLC